MKTQEYIELCKELTEQAKVFLDVLRRYEDARGILFENDEPFTKEELSILAELEHEAVPILDEIDNLL